MALSGTTSFSSNAAEIVEGAYQLLGVVADGESLTASQMQNGLRRLNQLTKKLVADGYHLWATQRGVLFVDTSSTFYDIGSTTTNHVTDAAGLSIKETTAAASSGATSIVVNNVTNILATQYIGIRQSDNTIHWTTISSISTLTINLTDALTADVDDGASVYVYSEKLQRPSRIIEARCSVGDGSEIPMTKISHTDYFGLTDKESQGTPTQFHYEPNLYNGRIYIWSVASSVDNIINFTCERVLQDINLSTDDVDFPQEWELPLEFNLALILTYTYTVDDSTFNRISAGAAQLLEDARDFDQEDASLIFAPQLN